MQLMGACSSQKSTYQSQNRYTSNQSAFQNPLNQIIFQKDQEIQKLKETINEKELKIKGFFSNHPDQALVAENQKLEYINNNLQTELDALKQKFEEWKNIKQQLEQEQREKQTLQGIASEIEQKKKDLERQFNKLIKEREELNDDKQRFKNKKEELENELAEKEKKLQLLQLDYGNNQVENDKLKEKLKTYKENQKEQKEKQENIVQSNLDQIQEQNRKLKEMNQQLTDENRKLQNELNKKFTESEYQTNQFQQLQQHCEFQVHQIQELESVKINQRQEITNQQQQINNLNTKVRSQNGNIEELNRVIITHKNNIEMKDQEIQILKKNIDEIKEQLNQTNKELENSHVNAKNRQLEQANTYKEEKLQIQNRISNLEMNHQNEISQLTKDKQALQEQIKQYKDLIKDHEKSKEELKQQHNEIQYKLVSIRSRLQKVFGNKVTNNQVIPNLIQQTCQLLNGTPISQFEKYENGNIKNCKFTIYKISWADSQIGKIIEEQKLYELYKLALNPLNLGQYEVQLTMSQIGQNELQQIKLFRVLKDEGTQENLKNKVFALIENKSLDCQMINITEATQLVINSAICDYYLKRFQNELRSQLSIEKNLIIGGQYIIKTEENLFYQAEIVGDSQIVQHLGGPIEIKQEQTTQFLTALSYYTFQKSKKELLISYIASFNNIIFNPYVCTKDGVLSQVDLGITEIQNISTKIENEKGLMGPYKQLFEPIQKSLL